MNSLLDLWSALGFPNTKEAFAAPSPVAKSTLTSVHLVKRQEGQWHLCSMKWQEGQCHVMTQEGQCLDGGGPGPRAEILLSILPICWGSVLHYKYVQE